MRHLSKAPGLMAAKVYLVEKAGQGRQQGDHVPDGAVGRPVPWNHTGPGSNPGSGQVPALEHSITYVFCNVAVEGLSEMMEIRHNL